MIDRALYWRESLTRFFHARCVLQGLKVAIVEGHDIGGTCVNRGCVPSKALLAASNEVRLPPHLAAGETRFCSLNLRTAEWAVVACSAAGAQHT